MSELTDFLEARLAEDVSTFRLEKCAQCLTYQHAPDDPATERFMAEVEAKRALVELHKVYVEKDVKRGHFNEATREFETCDYYYCLSCDHDRDYGHIGGKSEGCETLRLLASAYRGHPGYQEGWAL